MSSNILSPTHNPPFMFFLNIYRYRSYIWQMFYKFSSYVLQIFYKYSTNILQMFYKSSTNVLQMFYKCSTNILQMFYKCSTNVLQIFYKSSTNLLQIFFKYSTNVLQMFYKSSANVLITNLLCWLILIIRPTARVPNRLTNEIRSHSKKSLQITEHSGEKPHTVDNWNILETSVIYICQTHA